MKFGDKRDRRSLATAYGTGWRSKPAKVQNADSRTSAIVEPERIHLLHPVTQRKKKASTKREKVQSAHLSYTLRLVVRYFNLLIILWTKFVKNTLGITMFLKIICKPWSKPWTLGIIAPNRELVKRQFLWLFFKYYNLGGLSNIVKPIKVSGNASRVGPESKPAGSRLHFNRKWRDLAWKNGENSTLWQNVAKKRTKSCYGIVLATLSCLKEDDSG